MAKGLCKCDCTEQVHWGVLCHMQGLCMCRVRDIQGLPGRFLCICNPVALSVLYCAVMAWPMWPWGIAAGFFLSHGVCAIAPHGVLMQCANSVYRLAVEAAAARQSAYCWWLMYLTTPELRSGLFLQNCGFWSCILGPRGPISLALAGLYDVRIAPVTFHCVMDGEP